MSLHEAMLYSRLDENKVQCSLCARRCLISDGAQGFCLVRKNQGGTLYTLNYGKAVSAGVDPISKKPLSHFNPGSLVMSVAAAGCNFRCQFCDNWMISQDYEVAGNPFPPEEVVKSAQNAGCQGISYTYTEPTIFMEYAYDSAKLAHEAGLFNTFVSNGYMTIEAIDYAKDFLDGINVDLKSFSEDFYRDVCKARLAPVLETLRYIANHTDIWLEVTTLVVPGLNDSDDELKQIAAFIADNLGPHVPWHISRFHPSFEKTDTPPTPQQTLEHACHFGKDAGLHYVYVGNLPGSGMESTHCHQCGQLLIERLGYQIGQYNLLNGDCPGCGTKLPGFGLEPIQF